MQNISIDYEGEYLLLSNEAGAVIYIHYDSDVRPCEGNNTTVYKMGIIPKECNGDEGVEYWTSDTGSAITRAIDTLRSGKPQSALIF